MTYWNYNKAIVLGAYDDLVKPVVDAFEAFWRVTVQVFDAIVGFFKKWWPLLFVIFFPELAALVSIWNHTHAAIEGFAKAVWNAIYDYLKVTWTLISDMAKAVWTPIAAVITALVSFTVSWIKAEWAVATAVLSATWRGIETAAAIGWALIKGAIINPAVAAFDKVKSVYDTLKATLTGAWNETVSALKGLGSDFVQLGEGIVEGIIKGITNKAASIGDSLKGAAKSALNMAKSFLGINSPSRVFADEVGQWISKGVAQGVDNHASSATSAVRNLAAGLTGHIAGGPSLGSALGGGGQVVQYNVSMQVQGTVRADHDLRDLIQQELLRLGGRNISTWPSAAV
jgi:phage-related protein